MNFKNQKLFLSILTLGSILTVALFFRFYQLGQVPPGLNGDEATLAFLGLDVLAGNFIIFTPREAGLGAMGQYALALYFAFFDPTIISLRAFAGIVGVLSVIAAYFVIRQLPFRDENVTLPRQRREILAAGAALLLAVSYWHVDQSRLAFTDVLMLLGQDITFLFLWRALAAGRRIWFIVFGLSLGSMMYHYLPGKLVPAVLVLFFLLEWLIARRNALLVKYWRSLALAGILALVVALPLLLFVLFNYEMVMARALLPASNVAQMSPLQAIIINLNRFGLWPTFWLSGRWDDFFLGPTLTLCFVIGVVTCLTRLKRPAYLFLLVWWGGMVIPGVLAAEGIPPHARRAIGVATPTFALAALGLISSVLVLFWLARKIGKFQLNNYIPLAFAGILGAALVTWTGVDTFRRYFLEWGTSEEAKQTFHVYDLELVDIMTRESGAETVYLLLLDSGAGIINPILDNITFVYKGQATYDFLPDDEKTLPARLSKLTANKQIVRLVRWKVSKHTGADPKDVIDYYLEKQGQRIGTDSYRYFDIETYQLTDSASPRDPVGDKATPFAPAELKPLEVNFEGQLTLTGYAFGHETDLNDNSVQAKNSETSNIPTISASAKHPLGIPAGNRLWAELGWRKDSSSNTSDYQVSLWLEDDAGHTVGRTDKPLLNNIAHRGTSQWPAGDEERDYYLLPVDPTTSPGHYHLKAVLYEGASGRRLAPNLPNPSADLAVTLGEVTVLPTQLPVDPATIAVPERLDFKLKNGLQLVGIDFGSAGSVLRPGDKLTFRLWAYTTQPLKQNIAVVVGLAQDDNIQLLNRPQQLGHKDFPTVDWPLNTSIQTFIDIQIPPTAKNGQYNLGLRLLDLNHNEALAELPLKQMQIEGRNHTFDRPTIPHPLQVNFSNKIELLGYNLDLSRIESEKVVRIMLYWQALTEMDVSYKVFIHFLNEADQIVTQVDREPQGGEAPTSGWIKDEIITETIELPINENLMTVTHLNVGLYNPADGQRLSVSGEDGQIRDSKVEIMLPLPEGIP